MADHLEIRVADPMTDGCFGSSEEIVEDSDFMTEEHQSVDEMGADETGTAGDQDPLAF